MKAEVAPTMRVLVVEDCEDTAASMAMLLRLWGHDVRIAHDGISGLETARTFHPDIALLDLQLPRMDGLQMARQLRAEQASMRLIALTGFGQDNDRLRCHEAGFDLHLVKPTEPAELRAIVEGTGN
ncbi:MAG TPA: response regulator [Gemmataceae bacterium]|nr:response regulator [Gemmataceae bacterium]